MLTAAMLAIVLAPLGRPAREGDRPEAGTIAVYRHQLDEIEAERARGLVDEAEAAAARTEVSRRLLASAAAEDDNVEIPFPLRRAPVAIAVAALVPLLTLALYLTHGSPDLPSYPMAGRAQ